MHCVPDYWAVQAGLLTPLLTPLTFARHRLSLLAAFPSGAYFLHNGRRWQWICEFFTANFKDIFGGPKKQCWSAKKTTQRHFSHLPPLSPVIFATATVVAFVLFRHARFNFHCYIQRGATPTRKSARKWHCDLSRLLEQGNHGPSSNLWCFASLADQVPFLHIWFSAFWAGCRSAGTFLCGVEVINGWSVVSTSISAETSITLPSVTADISSCNRESSELVSNLSGIT